MMDYKARSEISGDSSFASFAEVIDAAVIDHTIWKIVYPGVSGKKLTLIRSEEDGLFHQEE